MEVRTREFASRVTFLTQATYRLAAKAARNDLDIQIRMLSPQRRIDELNICPTLGDRIAKKKDSFFFW
jgi:hypothetical protein